jgi:hypothetical protein
MGAEVGEVKAGLGSEQLLRAGVVPPLARWRTRYRFGRLADVLPSHAHHIGAPLRGVEQQREREARLRAD